MSRATLICEGRNVFVRPDSTLGTDFQHIRKVCREAGSRYDGAIKEEVLPIRKMPALVRAAVSGGLHLTATGAAIEGVRREAQRLREEVIFLEAVSGDFELYPFQSEGVGYLWQNPRALLFDEMGLGKTIQALMALEPDAATLVICPKVMKSEWVHECGRWRRDLHAEALDTFRYPEPGELLSINYARLPKSTDLKPWPKTNLIIDEAHYTKNSRAKRTQIVRSLVKRIQKRNGYAWLLTGTPLQNKPQELWALLVALGLHKSAYGSFTNFAKLFGGKKDAFGYVFSHTDISTEATDILRSIALRREREEVLPDLPTKTYRTFWVPAPDDSKVIASLESVDHDLLALALDDGFKLEDVACLAEARKELAWYKFEQALPFIAEYEAQDEPVVVFTAHRKPAEHLANREGWAGIHGGITSDKKRKEAIRDFQDGKLKGLACTIQAAGEGITLTRAHHAVFIDQSFVPTQNLQAEDRVCRIGQDRGVVVTQVRCRHYVDESVSKALHEKTQLIAKTTGKLVDEKRPSLNREALSQELEHIAEMMGG